MLHAFNYARLIAASTALLAMAAHAELQVWKMVGTTYETVANENPHFVAPGYLANGKSVSVLYAIDTDVAAEPGSSTYNAVLRFAINGIKSTDEGYIIAEGSGLNGINVWPVTSRPDGITFLSFNRFSGPQATSVNDALSDFSSATANGNGVDYRIDFGNAGSVRVKPTSFTKQTIPSHCKYPLYRLIDPKCAPMSLLD